MLSTNKYFKTFFSALLITLFAHAQDQYLKFDHINADNGLPQNSVYSIIKDKYGFMWFGTWGGAVRYDGYSLKVFRANPNDTTALPDNRINAIVLDSLQNIWIQTGEPRFVYCYNYEYENFKRYLIKNTPKSVGSKLKNWRPDAYPIVSNPHYSWISDHFSLRQTNRKSGKITDYVADPNRPFAISDNIINNLYLDDGDNLWIGTQNGGVNHANLNIKPFSYYNSDPGGAGLKENVVRAVCTVHGHQIWIGLENKGITVLDRETKRRKYLVFSKNNEHTQRIRAILCDHKGQIWVGTKGGLFTVNPQTYSVKNCSSGLQTLEVFAVFEDHEHTIWIGTFNGLARFDKATNQCNRLNPSLTGGHQIRSIVEDHKQNIWVATEDGGVARIEKLASGQFKSVLFVHKEGNDNSLINNRTFSVAEDILGMIWIGTNSGLSRLNPGNNSFKHFTLKNGLIDDIIMGVVFDGKESVWVSHKKGLTRINIRTFALQHFNIFDGLQGNEFSQNACFRDKLTGEIFFGGTNGLNSFFPDSFKKDPIKPKVVFTQLTIVNQIVKPGVQINNRVILEKSLVCTNKIKLTWHDKTFSIEFAALHFANPSLNNYKYKLEGYDKQWIFTDASKRTASYSELSPGIYTLKVFASNRDVVWGDTPAMLQIKVLPPWWLTWWAKTIAYLLLITVVFAIYKMNIFRKKIRYSIIGNRSGDTSPEKNESGNSNEEVPQDLRKMLSKSPDLKEMAINISDEAFLKKVTKLVEENLEDENFDIDTLAEKLKMSRSQFYRKIKALTNKSLLDFVTTLRMNKALEYLLSGDYNISETAYKVGFSQPNNFSRAFTKHFGKTPTQYLSDFKK
jgi:ligand-binding sensor domain-containing protein/AraC-like DNA-binding protein